MVLQRLATGIVSFLFRHYKPEVKYMKVRDSAIDPEQRDDQSLGFDLYAPKKIVLRPGETKTIDTGIAFEIPSYMGMYLWDKSSLALAELRVCGGVIDPGYRGSVGVIMENCSLDNFTIQKGSAIAQAVFQLAIYPEMIETTELSDTVRGDRGFGGKSDWADK